MQHLYESSCLSSHRVHQEALLFPNRAHTDDGDMPRRLVCEELNAQLQLSIFIPAEALSSESISPYTRSVQAQSRKPSIRTNREGHYRGLGVSSPLQLSVSQLLLPLGSQIHNESLLNPQEDREHDTPGCTPGKHGFRRKLPDDVETSTYLGQRFEVVGLLRKATAI